MLLDFPLPRGTNLFMFFALPTFISFMQRFETSREWLFSALAMADFINLARNTEAFNLEKFNSIKDFVTGMPLIDLDNLIIFCGLVLTERREATTVSFFIIDRERITLIILGRMTSINLNLEVLMDFLIQTKTLELLISFN